MKVVLLDERPYSWNKFYSGRHWSSRNEYAKAVHLLTLAAVREQLPPDFVQFNELVCITVRAYFKSRPIDPDNIMSKVYIDGLVDAGVIKDDSMQYVGRVILESHIDKHQPRVEIVVEDMNDVC